MSYVIGQPVVILNLKAFNLTCQRLESEVLRNAQRHIHQPLPNIMKIKIDQTMNFRKLILLIVIFIGLFSCKAQKSDYDNSVLWEIKKPGSNNLSYILGTIHVLDTTQINFPIETLETLLDKCGNLCIEIIPGQVNELKEINKYLYLKDEDLKISNRLEKEYYDNLMQIADSSDYFLKRFKPYLDSMRPTILSTYIEAERELIKTQNFVSVNYRQESDLFNYANKKGYKTIPLETGQQQIDWIVRLDLSFEKSLELLKKSIDKYNDNDSGIDIFQKYSEQDLALYPPDVFSDSILILRNTGMAEKIDSMMNIKSLFVAIGAAHLPYENGVLYLLEQKGYIIKPYKIDLKKKITFGNKVHIAGRGSVVCQLRILVSQFRVLRTGTLFEIRRDNMYQPLCVNLKEPNLHG